MPTLFVYDVDSLVNYSGSFLFPPFPNQPTAQIATTGNTIDYTGNPPPQAVSVTDDDSSFNDGDTSQQTVDQDITLEGVFIPAGTTLTPEYSYTLRPVGGTPADDITIYAFEVGVNNIVGFLASAPLQAGTTYTFVGSSNSADVPYANVVPCFGHGTLIETEHGDVPVQDLSVGDRVVTRDNGNQPIRWIGRRRLNEETLSRNPNLCPIRILAGALGAQQPARNLIVSPQHRLLVSSKIAQRMFDSREVLVAAKHLVEIDGIDVVEDANAMDYFHIMFDRHEVIYSNGAASESLFAGGEALKSLSHDAVEEIFAIFPELKCRNFKPTPVRPLSSGRLGRKLASRHASNQKPLVACSAESNRMSTLAK